MYKFKEISTKVLWDQFKGDKYFVSYFPNYPKGVIPDSPFFYDVNILKYFNLQIRY